MLVYSASSEWSVQACLLSISWKGGSSDPPLRASNDHRFIVGVPRAQRISGAALTPSCSGSSGPHWFSQCIFLPRWGVAWLNPQLRASNEGFPILSTSLKGSRQGCPLLRASNEHIPIVRVLRARRAPVCSLFSSFLIYFSFPAGRPVLSPTARVERAPFLLSPYLNKGEPGCLSGLGPCVSAVASLRRPAPGRWRRCSMFHSSFALLGMEQVSAPSVNEANSSQQGPGLSEGIQATLPRP